MGLTSLTSDSGGGGVCQIPPHPRLARTDRLEKWVEPLICLWA